MASLITYKRGTGSASGRWHVYILGKFVGNIWKENGGYRYYPKQSDVGGELFKSLNECKRSLEEVDA